MKKITIEQLARMTQDGFIELRKEIRGDLQSGLTGAFSELTKVMLDQFRLINEDIRDIKRTLNSTVSIAAEHKGRIEGLEARSSHIEKKVGIVRLAR